MWLHRSNQTVAGLKYNTDGIRDLEAARSNQTVAGLKSIFLARTKSSTRRFKSDRCGIEIENAPLRAVPACSFKSDRCGIEIPRIDFSVPSTDTFKSDRCGIEICFRRSGKIDRPTVQIRPLRD